MLDSSATQRDHPPTAVQHPDAATGRIVAFLRGIGIPVHPAEIPEKTFLPGIAIERGALRVDFGRLTYPGDLLHEAGHIAMMTPARRLSRTGDASKNMGEEIGAILWSWAALCHLDLPPEIVFHPDGYRGSSDWFIASFSGGTYTGLPLLQWMGLTLDPEAAAARGEMPFPHMLRWLREEPAP